MIAAPPLVSSFAFALCQPGAERALKREFARARPGWAPAYQRPGLVTFRLESPAAADLTLTSVFARAYGLSLGPFAELTQLAERLCALGEPFCLHVVEREPLQPDSAEAPVYVSEAEAALRELTREGVAPQREARLGQLVATVVLAPGDPPLLGLHRQDRSRSIHPGGRPPLTLPPEAPSRAYLKIEEAIQTFRLPVRAGDTALEIGAAPGGAAYALVRRGVQVIAVDPGALDPVVLALEGPGGARVTHLPIAAAELKREQLPSRVDWLLLDVHLAPQVALRIARRLASEHKKTLLGCVLTLKLNDWSVADRLEGFAHQAHEMGLVSPRIKQLASHRQEVALVGLTRQGTRRVEPR